MELSKKYRLPLVVVRVNYPGNKENYIVNSVFNLLNIELTYLYNEVINLSEGPVLIGVVDKDPIELKKYGIKLEESELGRMIDFDVYDSEFNQVSRTDLGLSSRSCIICDEPAHECIRSMKHSLDSVRNAYDNIFIEFISKRLGEFAKVSLFEELDLSPKPGLVTPFSNGSHKDMDYSLMKASIESLDFTELARASFRGYSEAKEAGVLLEKSMFNATNGVNTHKGGIYLLGTIIYAFVYSLKKDISLEEAIKVVSKDSLKLYSDPSYSSHGKEVFIKYGLPGILGDSEEGFPLIWKNLEFDGTRLLLKLMSECDDTTILYRHGLDVLEEVKDMSRVYNANSLDEIFIRRNISPGGSADLYSGVKMIQKINAFRR